MSELWSWGKCEEALERMFDALDWSALGKIYFHEDGQEHWEQLRPRVVTLGLDWARAALEILPEGGVSLYAGAGVAELPVLFAERFVRGRRVIATNRGKRECEVLEQGLLKVGLAGKLGIRNEDVAIAAARGGYDHLGCVSLFTDPESWPWLSAVSYGRIAPVQLDLAAFGAERDKARVLAAGMFAGLQRPGWITTTAEEIGWFQEQATSAGVAIEPVGDDLPTAVVGDAIGFVRVG